MMILSQKLSNDYVSCSKMLRDDKIINRSYALEWIKKILVKEESRFVDMSIQVFDRFVCCVYANDHTALADTRFLSISAACSVILSLKLLDSQSRMRLNFSHFSSFKSEDMISFEVRILNVIHGSIFPNCTPASFVRLIVEHCPLSTNADAIINTADQLLRGYLEEPEFLLFAPSTIALTALVVSFSLHHVDCTAWLDSIPDFCLPKDTNPLFLSQPNSLNLDQCLLSFEKMPMLRALALHSPTGVAELN